MLRHPPGESVTAVVASHHLPIGLRVSRRIIAH
jgi:hypothetical protein